MGNINFLGTTFTPDIYVASSSVKSEGQDPYTISLAGTHGLKESETVRLITEKNPELDVVDRVVDDKTFTVTTNETVGDKIIVYGKQCLDLKSVDYDAVAILNERRTGFFISDIFTCFWYDIVSVIYQLRYDIVPRTEILSLFSSQT
jgi:hypothetical protein